MTFGERVKRLRKGLGLKQADVVKRTHGAIKRTSLSCGAGGRRRKMKDWMTELGQLLAHDHLFIQHYLSQLEDKHDCSSLDDRIPADRDGDLSPVQLADCG